MCRRPRRCLRRRRPAPLSLWRKGRGGSSRRRGTRRPDERRVDFAPGVQNLCLTLTTLLTAQEATFQAAINKVSSEQLSVCDLAQAKAESSTPAPEGAKEVPTDPTEAKEKKPEKEKKKKAEKKTKEKR